MVKTVISKAKHRVRFEGPVHEMEASPGEANHSLAHILGDSKLIFDKGVQLS